MEANYAITNKVYLLLFSCKLLKTKAPVVFESRKRLSVPRCRDQTIRIIIGRKYLFIVFHKT